MNVTTTTAFSPALALYAKCVVVATFGLLFIGGLVTSHNAGMAVPDWPLSFGSVNPEGWWGDLPVRLEHGHRQFAAGVGLLIGILCAWVWRNGWSLLAAALAGVGANRAAVFLGLPPTAVAHLSIWLPALAFVVALLWMSGSRNPSTSRAVRGLAFAAFIGVCLQATFGGLRVTLETADHLRTALALRIAHGCVAQAELCLLVAIATFLSRGWIMDAWISAGVKFSAIRLHAWAAVFAVFGQLIVGAAMRHKGAGLAIPTFPEANEDGGLLPNVHNIFIDLNFAHTRFGAVFVTLLVLALTLLTLRRARGEVRLTSPAIGLLGLVLVQVSLGVYVIWHVKPITLTTIHVVNGAAVLALSLLLALRAGRFASEAKP